MIKFQKISKKLLLTFCIFLTLFTPTTTFALSESKLDFFNQNNILFYDPEAVDPCYNMSAGNTNFEKIVKYFSGNNKLGVKLKAEAIAGLIANLKAESGLSAFRLEEGGGGGYGIAQFTPATKITPSLQSDNRTSGFFNEYYNPEKYGHAVGESGIPDGVPPEVNDAWLAVQLDFAVKSEFKSTTVGTFRNIGGVMGLDYLSDNYTILEALEASKTASDAARMFVWIYERPSNKSGDATKRSKIAEEILPKVKSAMNSSSSSQNKVSDGSDVTIIGDSITEGSKAKILAKLPKADIHSQVGKQFYTGSANNPGGKTILENLIQNNQLRNTVVFALGTNGSITENQANEVYKLVGEKRHLIFTTNFTTSNGYIGNNNIFKKLQNDHQNVAIADWKAIIQDKASTYLSSDGIHPNEKGQNLFSELIISTINEQGNSIGNCSVDGGLTKKQIKTLSDYYLSDKVSGADLPSGKWNCVSLSIWFIKTFTSMKKVEVGHGINVVNDLRNRYNFKTGTEPKPFSIFSVSQGLFPEFGHTGVVLAVKNNKIYTLEASWSKDGSMDNQTILGEYDKSFFINSKHPQDIFAYTDGILQPSEILKITGDK